MQVLMPLSASRLLEISDRRDKMVLTMAVDAAGVKAKFREARHKKAREIAYRGVRYQRFNGRRKDVMEEEEVRKAKCARHSKSLQRMVKWLEAQDRANAEEGSPRADDDGEDQEAMPLILLVIRPPSVVEPVKVEENVVLPGERDQRLITFFFVIREGSVCRVV